MIGEDGERVFYYERYADDLLFGIKKGDGSREVALLLRKSFRRALRKLKLHKTFWELVREQGGKGRLQVLGLLFPSAKKIFNLSENLDQISWNSMLSGYMKCGQIEPSYIMSRNKTSGATTFNGQVNSEEAKYPTSSFLWLSNT